MRITSSVHLNNAGKSGERLNVHFYIVIFLHTPTTRGRPPVLCGETFLFYFMLYLGKEKDLNLGVPLFTPQSFRQTYRQWPKGHKEEFAYSSTYELD